MALSLLLLAPSARAAKPWLQSGGKYNHTTGVIRQNTDQYSTTFFTDQNSEAFRATRIWVFNNSASEVTLMRVRYTSNGNSTTYVDGYGYLIVPAGATYVSEVWCDGLFIAKAVAGDDVRWEANR